MHTALTAVYCMLYGSLETSSLHTNCIQFFFVLSCFVLYCLSVLFLFSFINEAVRMKKYVMCLYGTCYMELPFHMHRIIIDFELNWVINIQVVCYCSINLFFICVSLLLTDQRVVDQAHIDTIHSKRIV